MLHVSIILLSFLTVQGYKPIIGFPHKTCVLFMFLTCSVSWVYTSYNCLTCIDSFIYINILALFTAIGFITLGYCLYSQLKVDGLYCWFVAMTRLISIFEYSTSNVLGIPYQFKYLVMIFIYFTLLVVLLVLNNRENGTITGSKTGVLASFLSKVILFLAKHWVFLFMLTLTLTLVFLLTSAKVWLSFKLEWDAFNDCQYAGLVDQWNTHFEVITNADSSITILGNITVDDITYNFKIILKSKYYTGNFILYLQCADGTFIPWIEVVKTSLPVSLRPYILDTPRTMGYFIYPNYLGANLPGTTNVIVNRWLVELLNTQPIHEVLGLYVSSFWFAIDLTQWNASPQAFFLSVIPSIIGKLVFVFTALRLLRLLTILIKLAEKHL